MIEFESRSSAPAAVAMGVRLIPPQMATAVYEAHPELYAAAQFSAFRGDRAEIGASVILMSGCQDDQLSADTGYNGLFTLKMLKVWNKGKFNGNYSDFVNQIRKQMPKEQQPNFATAGRHNSQFESENPFTILTNNRIQPSGKSFSIPPPEAALTRPEKNGDSLARDQRSATLKKAIWAPGLEDPDQSRQQKVTNNVNGAAARTVMRGPGPLRDLILGIDKISVPFESDIGNGVGKSWHEFRDGKRFRITSTPRAAVNTFESLAAFDVHADVLWPGSMVQGRSLPGAVLQPIALNRLPGTIVLTNLMVEGSSGTYTSEVERPSLGSVQQTVQDLLAQKFEEDTPAKISFYMKQFYSLEHAMMQIGASYSWLSGSGAPKCSRAPIRS